MWLLLQVAFTLFQLGLWTAPVSVDSSPGRPVLQAEDGRDVPQSRVCRMFLLCHAVFWYWWKCLVPRLQHLVKHVLYVCMNRYWTGYLYLCCELQRRTEAFSTICQLDDISLLEEPEGRTGSQHIFLLHNLDMHIEVHTICCIEI